MRLSLLLVQIVKPADNFQHALKREQAVRSTRSIEVLEASCSLPREKPREQSVFEVGRDAFGGDPVGEQRGNVVQRRSKQRVLEVDQSQPAVVNVDVPR